MDSLMNYSARDRRAIAQSILAGRYEYTDAGLFVPACGGTMLSGTYHTEVWHKGELVESAVSHNLITDEGLNYLLNVAWDDATTKPAGYYCAVFEGNATPGASWTAANFVSNATECTAYDETTRVAFVRAASTAKVITNNASKAVFTFNATKTIYGGAITTASAKSATTGKLVSAVRFPTSHSVLDDYVLNLRYDHSAASA